MLLNKIIMAPRWFKRSVSVLADLIGLTAIGYMAIWLRFGEIYFNIAQYTNAVFLLPLIAIPIFIRQGLYNAVVRYIGFKFSVTVFIAFTLAVVIWITTIVMLELKLPRSVIVNVWFMGLVYITGTRIVARWILSEFNLDRSDNAKKVIIWGAGASGQQLLNAIAKVKNINVVGFVDDDTTLHNMQISSMTVYPRASLANVISNTCATELFLAIPSITAKQKSEILAFLSPLTLKVSTLPGIDEIIGGKVSFADVREINIEDLLGRDPVPPIMSLLDKCILNKTILVTGAGGSIGSELCRQILKSNPSVLILFELSEYALYTIEQELLKQTDNQIKIIPILGNINNKEKLNRLFTVYKVDTIYHAAAYKHVPMVEHNIKEGLVNNTFGTQTLAKVGAKYKVKNFVLISTDKAVRPTNYMGASKRLAEMVLQAMQDENKGTIFTMVRFGNVLGSSGSVIPLFKKQIVAGGPVTVTHKDITRYFMTISEASTLVIQAGAMGKGGDVFVLDMGDAVQIKDLAKQVIKLSGYTPIDKDGNGDIAIQYTGLRPGEKLYEELLIGDNVDGTNHPRIMKANEDYLPLNQLSKQLLGLESALTNYQFSEVEKIIKKMVSGFNHSSKNADYMQSNK
jgi:FlaA1/EpsC-like NDP-sugar epimerase